MSNVTYKDGAPVSAPKPKKKRYWWRYLLTFFGGFLACILVIGGGVAIFGTVVKTGDALSVFGLNPNDILQPYYQSLSILQLATTLPSLKYETLGDIYEITPMVKSLIDDTVNPLLEKELHFTYDWDELSTKPFKLPVQPREGVDTTEDLGTYIGRAIKEGVYLKDFIKGSNLPKIVNAFLYPKNEQGEYDFEHPYSLASYINAGPDFFEKIVNGIKVKEIVDNPNHNPLLDELGEWGLKDFTDEKINSLSIGLFLEQGSTDPFIQELSTWKVSDLKNTSKINGLKLGLFLEQGSTDPFIQELSTWSISDLKNTSKIGGLSIGLFLEQGSTDPFIQELSTWTINDLKDPNKINNLSIGLFLDPNSTDPLIQELSTWKISDLKDKSKFDNLSLSLFLDTTSTNPLIQKLCTWKVMDLKNETNFKNLYLSEVIQVTPTTPQLLKTLIEKNYTIGMLETTDLYKVLKVSDVFNTGDSDLLQALSDKFLYQLQDQNTILNLKLGQVIPSSLNNSIIAKFADYTLKELTELDIHNLRLDEIFSEDEIAADPILTSLHTKFPDLTVGGLSKPETLNALKLGDIISDDSNSIVNALKPYSISEIPTEINKLTLGTILDIDTTDPTTPVLMITLADIRVDELNNTLSHLTLGQVMDLSSYPNLNNDQVKNTEINEIDTLIDVLKEHLKLKDVVDIDDATSPALLVHLKDYKLKELESVLTTEITSLKLNEIMTITSTSHPLLIALQDKSLSELESVIPSLTLGQFMNINDSSHPLLKALKDYSLSNIESEIPNIKLGQILSIDDSSHPLLKALQGYSISELEGQINNLTLGQILEITGASHPLLQALATTSLSNLETTIPSLTLGNILTINDSSPQILKTLKDTSLENFATDIEDLSLSQLVDIDESDPSTPQILIALKDIKILDGTSLVEKVNNLKLKDIYRESDCVGVFKYIWENNNDGDLLITQIPGAVNNLPLTMLLEEYIYIKDDTIAKYYDAVDDAYYDYADLVGGLSPTGHEVEKFYRISPIYWFLLTEEGESFSDDEKYYILKKGADYTINSGLNMITTNFTYHMKSENLYTLYDAGLIDNSVLTRSDLDKQFVYNMQIIRVGELTMTQFLQVCMNFIPSI